MEDNKLWHDAEKELPEYIYPIVQSKVDVVFTAYDSEDDIVLCMNEGRQQCYYGIIHCRMSDGVYDANGPITQEIEAPDKPVFYTVEPAGEDDDGDIIWDYYVYDSPIKWAYTCDIHSYLKTLSMEED